MNMCIIFSERREEDLMNRINKFLQAGKEVVNIAITSRPTDPGAGYLNNLVAILIYKAKQ